FAGGHYAQAVSEAFKLVDNLVQRKSGLPVPGFDLMMRAFNDKTPALKLNALKTESDRNEQAGYMHMFAGSMRGIRNVRAHFCGPERRTGARTGDADLRQPFAARAGPRQAFARPEEVRCAPA